MRNLGVLVFCYCEAGRQQEGGGLAGIAGRNRGSGSLPAFRLAFVSSLALHRRLACQQPQRVLATLARDSLRAMVDWQSPEVITKTSGECSFPIWKV